MAADYHGLKPQSKSDIFMAKKHLVRTHALNDEKIIDHENAKDDAIDNGDAASAAYNQSHLDSHQADNDKIETSMKTVANLKPVYDKVNGGTDMASGTTKKTGTTNGKPNVLGGGGRFQQLTNKGVSPGLASFLGRKKFGATQMAKMAANGKS